MIIHPVNADFKRTKYTQRIVPGTLMYHEDTGTFSGTINTGIDFFDNDGNFIASTMRQKYCPSFTLINYDQETLP